MNLIYLKDKVNDFRDGDVYEGEWKDGKKHGKGKLITKDGKCYTVKFEGAWIGVFVYG